jgi:hypothetical protein
MIEVRGQMTEGRRQSKESKNIWIISRLVVVNIEAQ